MGGARARGLRRRWHGRRRLGAGALAPARRGIGTAASTAAVPANADHTGAALEVKHRSPAKWRNDARKGDLSALRAGLADVGCEGMVGCGEVRRSTAAPPSLPCWPAPC